MAKFVMEDNLKKHDVDKDGQISRKEYLSKSPTLIDLNSMLVSPAT